MKYGVGTTIKDYEILEKKGFDFIELAGNQIAKMSEVEFENVKQILAAGKVKCCGFNAALPSEIVLCGDKFDIAKVKIYAELICKRGKELGIKAIGVGSPKSRRFQVGDDEEKAWEQVELFMTVFTDIASKYNLIVMYESLNRTESVFGLKLSEGVKLVKKIDRENFGLVFDIYHMFIEGESIDELKEALPYVRHIHIAERVGEERRYPSYELYDYYKNVLSVVKEYGYDGAICTEAFDGDFCEGVTRSLQLLKQVIEEV